MPSLDIYTIESAFFCTNHLGKDNMDYQFLVQNIVDGINEIVRLSMEVGEDVMECILRC